MAKKKTKKKYRNAASASRRNAIAPAITRVPRARASTSAGGTSMNRLGYTAAGAAGTALVGAMLAGR